MFKNGVIIGTFQPFHNGHKELVEYALANAEHIHIIIRDMDEKIGIHKLWETSETVQLICKCFPNILNRISFHTVSKPKYNEVSWTNKLLKIIDTIDEPIVFGKYKNAALIQLINEYNIPFERFNNTFNITSDTIRMCFLSGISRDELSQYVPNPILKGFDNLIGSQRLGNILADNKFAKDYAESAKKYTPFFVTADAILIHHNRVLLVTRGKNPGMGLRAFPGGFVDHNERTYDAALRELTEETCINIPVYELKKRFVKTKSYDDPKRSLRGRVITHAYLFDVSDIPLDKIKFDAADDAAEVHWFNISDINSKIMFEDHYDILMDILE